MLLKGRGLSLGGTLIEAILGAVLKIIYRELRLDTLPDMAQAITLYRQAGFEPIEAHYDTLVARARFLGRSLEA